MIHSVFRPILALALITLGSASAAATVTVANISAGVNFIGKSQVTRGDEPRSTVDETETYGTGPVDTVRAVAIQDVDGFSQVSAQFDSNFGVGVSRQFVGVDTFALRDVVIGNDLDLFVPASFDFGISGVRLEVFDGTTTGPETRAYLTFSARASSLTTGKILADYSALAMLKRVDGNWKTEKDIFNANLSLPQEYLAYLTTERLEDRLEFVIDPLDKVIVTTVLSAGISVVANEKGASARGVDPNSLTTYSVSFGNPFASPTVVPLPAAGWLLLSVIAGLGAAGRFRRPLSSAP